MARSYTARSVGRQVVAKAACRLGEGWKGYSTFTSGMAVGPDGTVHLACNIVTDSNGTPYVLYISHLEKPGQLILARPDKRGKWTQRTIVDAERKYPNMRPIGSCFPFTITADNALHILLELVPFGDDWENGKPSRLMVLRSDPIKRLVRLVSTDRGKTFSVESLIEPGMMFNMVNIERPTGVNRIASGESPAWMYFDGSPDYPRDVKVRNNNVYFVQRR